MTITVRPTVPEDLPFLTDRSLPCRIQATTMLVDDTIVALGGLAFPQVGGVLAFAEITPAARKYPIALHRVGIETMRRAHLQKLGRVWAQAQPNNPAAERWLKWFGFTRVTVSQQEVWLWRDENL